MEMTVCCENNICSFCFEDLKMSCDQPACPFCQTCPFSVTKLLKEGRRYLDTPQKPIPMIRSTTPIKIGDSFDELKRKMRAFTPPKKIDVVIIIS